MDRYYTVKLEKGHTAAPDQIVDGRLAFCGKVCKYGAREAAKKALRFGGKVEGTKLPYDVVSITMAQIDARYLGARVVTLLRGDVAFTEVDNVDEEIIHADRVSEILEQFNAPNSLLHESDEVLDQLDTLQHMVMGFDYIHLINIIAFENEN